MADNVPITAGTGTNVATDDVSGNHYQYVKLADGTADSSAKIAGDATNGLDVDVTRLPVVTDINVVSITITRPADTTTYAAGDAIEDSTSSPTAFSSTGFARATGGSGRITSVTIIDSSLVTPSANLELWIFDTAYTANNDNAAWAPSDANANQLVGVVLLGGNPVVGTVNAIYNAQGLDIPYVCLTTTTLWFALVVRNAYVPTNQEVFKIRVGVERYG